LEANSIYASRKGKSKELIVTHSNKSSISIGTVVVKIDSLLVDELSNESIIRLLQEPNRIMEFNTDIINQCLKANSIYASRKRKSKELIVTHSNKSSISIGTVVVKIDSILVDELSNESIIRLLQEPNRIIEFNTDLINQCLEANSIYASRNGKSKELIVTHSNKSSISIGTVVVKIEFNLGR
jgi:hypothetical protein